MHRATLVISILVAIAIGLLGCGGSEEGGSGVVTTTTTTTTTDPYDNIPNPFCEKQLDFEVPHTTLPIPGQAIGWTPTGEKVGNGWCAAHAPEKTWNLNKYCGLESNALTASANPQVKVITQNLMGNMSGNVASKNIAKFGPFDLMAFQECENVAQLLKDAAAAGMSQPFEHHEIYDSYVNLCLAYRSDIFEELAQGSKDVAEDLEVQHDGKRAAQWVRLKHKSSGEKIFFLNFNGPASPGTGGLCGSRATAYNLLQVIAENAKVGDSVIFASDLNAPFILPHPEGNFTWAELSGTLKCHMRHIFADPSLDDHNGLGNIYSTCTNVIGKEILPKGGSLYHALQVVLELKGTSGHDDVKEMSPAPAVGNSSFIARGETSPFQIHVEGTPDHHITKFVDLVKDPAALWTRNERLRQGQVIKQYHQTTEAACKAIIKTRFLVGHAGIAGGGIYFANSAAATAWKAQEFGCMIEVWVALGNAKKLPFYADKSITLEKMAQWGYDSSWIPRGVPEGAAPETVVYFSDQILQMSAYPCHKDGKKIGPYWNGPLSDTPPAFKCSENGKCDGPSPLSLSDDNYDVALLV